MVPVEEETADINSVFTLRKCSESMTHGTPRIKLRLLSSNILHREIIVKISIPMADPHT
jgi:hypothetical protein